MHPEPDRRHGDLSSTKDCRKHILVDWWSMVLKFCVWIIQAFALCPVVLSVRGSAVLCFKLKIHLGIPIRQRSLSRAMHCQISVEPINKQPKYCGAQRATLLEPSARRLGLTSSGLRYLFASEHRCSLARSCHYTGTAKLPTCLRARPTSAMLARGAAVEIFLYRYFEACI